jgi:hypothetical protein
LEGKSISSYIIAFCGNMEKNLGKLRSVSNQACLECTTPTCMTLKVNV